MMHVISGINEHRVPESSKGVKMVSGVMLRMRSSSDEPSHLPQMIPKNADSGKPPPKSNPRNPHLDEKLATL